MGALLGLFIIGALILVVIKNPNLLWIILGIGALIIFVPVALPIIGIIIAFVVGSVGFVLSIIFGLFSALIGLLPIILIVLVLFGLYVALVK